MARFLGLKPGDGPFVIRDFRLEEDRSKALAEGVVWRRRRFVFEVPAEDDPSNGRPEGLCINEVTLDSDAKAETTPCLASQYSHLVDMAEIENAYWATTFASGAIRQGEGQRGTRLYLNVAPFLYGDGDEDPAALLRQLDTVQKNARANMDLDDAADVFDPYLSEAGEGPFGVARYLPAFPASRLVQSSEDILAATNAGYFLNFPEEYDDGVSALHQPMGGHIIDGRFVMPAWVQRPGVLRLENGETRAALFGPEDMQILVGDLEPVALHRGGESKNLHGSVWRHFDDERPAPAKDGVQLAFSGSVLLAVEPANGELLRAPFGGAVVYLEGKHAAAALDEATRASIHLRLKKRDGQNPRWLISAGPFLVHNSKALSPAEILSPGQAGEFGPGGPAPTRFPFNTGGTMAPRTAFGVLPSGGFKIVVVDGRRSGEHSCGLTLEGMAHLMQWVGCETAVNFDGGGSSVLAVEGADFADMLKEDSPYGVVNIPSDAGGVERIVPLFLIVRGKRGGG